MATMVIKNPTLDLGISNSTGQAGPSKSADRLKSNSDFDEAGQDKISNLSDANEFSRIEQLMKGKRFSRDEINRLTEILNSRVVGPSNVEQEKKKPSIVTGGEAEGALLSHENPIISIEEKQEFLNRALVGTSTPLLQSTLQDQVAASPIDIAKAYMGSRASEVGLGSKSIMSKDGRALLQSDEFASNPFIPSPSPKSSICWPGAMVQDQRGYLTPQSQRGRFGLQNFPRTPYSRTIYSKSKSNLSQSEAVDNRGHNFLSTPLQQSQTPNYGQDNSRSEVLNDGYGSVGPIRRIRHKFGSEAPRRGSVSFHSSQNGPSQVENSSISKSFFPATKKNLEPGTSSSSEFQSVENMVHSSEVGVSTLKLSSSKAVRAILEHLDGNKPTPKEKSAELKLATSWKNPSSSQMTDVVPKELSSSLHFGVFDSCKNTDLVVSEVSAKKNDDTTSDFQIKSTDEASMGFADNKQKGRNQLWSNHNQINGPDVAKIIPNAPSSELQKKPPLHSTGTKPFLTSISVDKPNPRWKVNPDNSAGFTFPVSASSGVLSEPPTPSIMPSFSAGGLPQPKEGPAVPSYTFGTKSSSPALVFSFPSTTSTVSNPDEPSDDLKFNFGSEKKTRVSFRPAKSRACNLSVFKLQGLKSTIVGFDGSSLVKSSNLNPT
ncbi:hypothetical protein F0562_030111 [Nyssa sinensis]|uniref:Nuclear pore complex protein NUP1 n=1 Tax=Nyssa sinensis TaxID=561372 RepID=A0A5J5AXU6_9ASTE|nr:hypothetical protein F0562_030111 [Nyssa sinensis]